MNTWIEDAKGNKCSVEFFGSVETAKKALDSLIDCDNCINCSDCSRCSDCSDCSGCAGCSGCARCSDCSGCAGCSGCARCSRVAWLIDKKDLRGDQDAASANYAGSPPIPVIPNIHATVLAAVTAAPDALCMGTWHTCSTTHCRGGWAVHLAGEAGYALERFHNAALAAQLIYRESNPALPVSPPRFYEDDATALADMRRMAELEAAQAPASGS